MILYKFYHFFFFNKNTYKMSTIPWRQNTQKKKKKQTNKRGIQLLSSTIGKIDRSGSIEEFWIGYKTFAFTYQVMLRHRYKAI
jgi:hypothetical protein